MAKIPSTDYVEGALADAPATLEPRAWIGEPTIIEEDPTRTFNGRPVLVGRRLSIDEWNGLQPERAQHVLMQYARNAEDDPNPPKLASPPMPPVFR